MNKKIIFLVSIPVVVVFLFLIIHFSFLDKLQNIQQKAANLRAKQVIASDINYEIIKVKSLFLQLPLLSNNKKTLYFYTNSLKIELNKLSQLLNILKSGGKYEKQIRLNIVGKDYFEKTYIYHKNINSIEVINLLPKVKYLNKKIENLLKITNLIYKNKSNREVVIFFKRLDSVFRRMIEDSNRLFYKTQIELNSLESQLKYKTELYGSIEFYMIMFLILIFIVIGYLIIKELTLFNEELQSKLYIDELTQIYTRKKLEEISKNENSILYLIDIDDFNEINELFGMDIGDEVLKIVAKKLQKYNPSWIVFRVSADVFGLFLDNVNKMKMSIEDKVVYLKQHIMFEPIKIDEYDIDLNITMSIAFGENALNNAFVALNIAKEKKLSYIIFQSEEEFKAKIEYNKIWQKEIKLAISENRIEPFFQPIVDQNKNILKYESLMRMKKVENGEIKYIPPFFIDIAIKTKQYEMLSKQMIEKSFKYFKNKGELSINISYIDMNSKIIKEVLEYLIIKYKAQNRLIFEILEDEEIQDYNVMKEFIDYFRQYGVKIAIDDFGSVYSNFKMIKYINPDYIKFDGSLIKNIDKDKHSYLIVKNLVNFAKEMGIKTIAEYVHSKEVFDTCIYLGVDYFQGYYINEPKKEIK